MTMIRTQFVQSRAVLSALVLLGPLVFAGCEQEKSASPLSPSVAGPMAGITIDAPPPLQPTNGAGIQDRDQPVTVLLGSVVTNSPRPFTIRVQLSADSTFASVLFAQGNLIQGSNGQTRFTLPKLQAGRMYYWRSQADDGANKSPWSTAVRFEVLVPVTLGRPTPRSPVASARTATATPELVVGNGTSSGSHGQIYYQFQIADNPLFSPLVANAEVAEGGNGETRYTAPAMPASDKVFYWRTRMSETTTTGDWSAVETFLSPVAPPTPAPPPPGSGGLPTGNCDSLVNDKPALVACIHATINPGSSAARAFEVTKRVAWALRGEGAGLLIKNGGENIISWRGYSFSLSRICYPDGHIYKVLSDAGEGGANGPTWADNDFVDPSLYVPAIDPSLPEPEPLVEDFTVGLWLDPFMPEAALYVRRPRIAG